MHADKPSIVGMFFTAALMLWAVNYGWVQWRGYPFAYCIGAEIIAPLRDLHRISFWVVMLVFIFQMSRQKWGAAFAAALLLGLISELPNLADVTFRLGRAC